MESIEDREKKQVNKTASEWADALLKKMAEGELRLAGAYVATVSTLVRITTTHLLLEDKLTKENIEFYHKIITMAWEKSKDKMFEMVDCVQKLRSEEPSA